MGKSQVPFLTMDAEMRSNLEKLAKIEGFSMKTTAKLLFREALQHKMQHMREVARS